ncbi:hypothetical protein TWF192_009831 [Orbilia oligospora]|uniref:Uncharacterized protein n=1 Tax=Orbilia oligospora TaxID=2813651 RepID=A0A6G1MLF2_ORBOL|nr:hypothetical protein TWF679_005425 [Orbilia oligospora]KAF3260550.1 hypothetical protein TWF192_009831 [Orbilia oligospora]
MFRLWSQVFLLGLLATGTEAAVKSITPRRVTTKTATVWEIVTSSFVETLYERQEGLCNAGGGLEFCSDVRSQWFYSNEFGFMNSTGGNPSATTTTTSPSASASAEFQQILSGSAFQLFVTQENGTIAYVSINSDGFAYLIGSRTGQLFQWSESTLKTYETSPRSFLALPDSEASRRNIRLADRQTLTNSTNRGTIKASEIIPDGASTNFTLILREVDTELVLTWEQREALFGTGAGCTTNLAAPDSVLAFGTADDYDTLPGCSVVSLSARVANGVSSLSSDVNTGTDTQTASGSSSSSASRSASRSPSQSGASNGSKSLNESPGSFDSSDNDSITSVSSSGSNLPSSTDSGPITSNSGSSTTSASPGSSGTSSPSNTNSPESCSSTTCSSSSSDSSSSVSSTTWGCVTETPIPASLSCPNHVEWDYITLDKDVYSLCTGYSISLTSGLTTDADAINAGTIRLLPCLESCVSSGYEGALFSAHAQWGFTKNTWQCGCGTTTNNFVLPTVSPIGMFTSKTAAVFICSNTFDYTGSTNDPARDTITVPPVSECYLPVSDKVSAFKRCPYNTANTWQNVIYSDGQVVTSLCPGAKFATTSDLFPWSTFSAYPIPVDMSTCLRSCSAAVGYPNTCPGVALVVDSTSISNGYRAKCVMATGDDLALITTDPAIVNTLRWLTAGEHLCPNGFALPSCAAALVATPSTASCCPGVRSQHLYTWGSSVFNICEGCMWAVASTLGPIKTGTANQIFYDQCISSYCQGGETCSGIGVLTSTVIAGASPMYQCVKMGANDATMTSTIPVNAGTSFYGTNVAFLCTNTFALQPSQPITSDLAPVYQICMPATQFAGFVIWPSIFATTKALYDWGGLAVTTSDLLTAGCTYGCTENNGKRPSDQPTWGQLCMVAVTASAKYWEVVREKGNDGKCYCRWPQDSVAAQAFTLSSYTVNTDVIEVYAYTSPGS